MCSSVDVKGIYVPRNDLEFVKQATKPLREVLCLEPDQCTDYITDLETDHAGISKMCQQALTNEAKRVEQEKKSDQNSWKAYSLKLLRTSAFTTATAMAVGAVFAYVSSMSLKKSLIFSGVAGLMWGYFNTPTIISKEAGSSELPIKACVERNWMKLKLVQVNTKIEAAEKTIAANPRSEEGVFKNRDLLLLVKSYLEEAGRY
jgi:hypothetical protein